MAPAHAMARAAAAAALCLFMASCAFAGGTKETWKVPEIKLAPGRPHPVVACTAEELARLRAAWGGKGAAHDAVARIVAQADAVVGKPIHYPPRGGQHNQWYQCDQCQAPLQTVDASHHRCPRCGHVYSGYPYDDVVYAHIHNGNLRALAVAAWAWAITGDGKYARYAAGILLGYADRYREYPFHGNAKTLTPWAKQSGGHLFEQTLNEANVMAIQIAPAYDLVYDSPALTDADRARIRDGLIVPILENIGRYRAGKGNWQSWHNAGMLWGGAVIGDETWVRRAVADPENGFAYQMTASLTSDGMWYENSWGYHFYALDALVAMAEGARRLGIDLWSHPAFRKAFLLPAHYTMADGLLPRFADDVQSTARGHERLMEPAYHAYHDPALLALLRGDDMIE